MEMETQMKRTKERIEYGEKFFDFCYCEYIPNSPYVGKLKSSELLFKTFEISDCPEKFYSLVGTIREEIGYNRTVWGVKQTKDGFEWELYFYDYQKNDPNTNLRNIIKIISPYLKFPMDVEENIPFFMFSFNITKSNMNEGVLNKIQIYLMDPWKGFGRSYRISGNGINLENIYVLFENDSPKEMILTKLRQSAFIDFDEISLNDILIPEMADSKAIFIANKTDCDGFYVV